MLLLFPWGCGSQGSAFLEPDAGMDADDSGTEPEDNDDAGVDIIQDAGPDEGMDAGQDAGMDAGQDAGPDAGMDAGRDAGVDAGQDAGIDAGVYGDQVDGAGDDQLRVRYCVQVCEHPADCSNGWPPWDEDNYSCDNGACRYEGCLSDDECQAVAGMESYVCVVDELTQVRTCTKSCSSVSDCVMASGPWDEDNYRCEAGACQYTGCNSDQECESVQGMESYVCAPQFQGGVDLCQPGCSTVEDCDLGSQAYDQDNYTCDNGLCVYTGCNSDAECQASMGGVPSECR